VRIGENRLSGRVGEAFSGLALGAFCRIGLFLIENGRDIRNAARRRDKASGRRLRPATIPIQVKTAKTPRKRLKSANQSPGAWRFLPRDGQARTLESSRRTAPGGLARNRAARRFRTP
jgi:hypothetical protein